MQFRKLINAELKLSELGLGCASYWGKKSYSEKQAIDVVHKAIESGVNYIDTGHSYSGGHAEVRLGKAIKHHNKDHLIISSKAGTRLGHFNRLYNDFSPEWIRQSCELSLSQLRVDQLPIFFLHGPNPEDLTNELFIELEKLQLDGKIGLIGVNAFADHILKICLNEPKVQVVMLDYNLYKPERSDLIQQLTTAGKDVIVAGALAGAIYDERLWQFQGIKSIWYWLRAWKNNPQLKGMRKQMGFLNNLPDLSATQAALAYVLNNQNIKSALIGTTQESHLSELIAASEIQLKETLIKKIES